MPRVLRFVPEANGGVTWELDGARITEPIRIQHVVQGGGVWFNDVPQFDVTYLGPDSAPRFTIPPIEIAPDWYERLELGGPYAFVDWNDTDFVRSLPMLREESLRRHPGRQAIAWVMTLRRVSRILRGNAQDLIAEIEQVDFRHPAFGLQFESTEGSEQTPRRKDPDDGPADDFERLLHNFIAALMSRVDMVRVLVRDDWSPTEDWMQSVYRQQVAVVFGQDGLHDFLQGLRNFMLHKQLPKSVFTMNLASELTVDVCLDPKHLLDNWDWKATARQWLRDQGDKISVGPLVATYTARAAAFDIWLEEQYLADKQALIDAYVAEAQRYFAETKQQS